MTHENLSGADRQLAHLLHNLGLTTLAAAAGVTGQKFSLVQVEAALEKAKLSGTKAVEAKLRLVNAGLLDKSKP